MYTLSPRGVLIGLRVYTHSTYSQVVGILLEVYTSYDSSITGVLHLHQCVHLCSPCAITSLGAQSTYYIE